jgi:hypothetical protein
MHHSSEPVTIGPTKKSLGNLSSFRDLVRGKSMQSRSDGEMLVYCRSSTDGTESTSSSSCHSNPIPNRCLVSSMPLKCPNEHYVEKSFEANGQSMTAKGSRNSISVFNNIIFHGLSSNRLSPDVSDSDSVSFTEL